jgi:hypothetical protein
MRIVTAAALAFNAMSVLSPDVAIGAATFSILQLGVALLLLAGLWTPMAGVLVVVFEGWLLSSWRHDPWAHILLATLGGALALMGPGAWSADARLFGWKRIDIRNGRTRDDTSAEPVP